MRVTGLAQKLKLAAQNNYTVSRPLWEDVLFSSFCIFRIMECNYPTNGKMQKLENETSSPSGGDTVYKYRYRHV